MKTTLRTPRILAVLAAATCLAAPASGDVIFEEPTPMTCGRSEWIVLATAEGTTVPGPFTNATSPTVKFRADECWKGCHVGEAFAVAHWIEPRPSHSGKPRPAPADAAAEEAAWQRQPVNPPALGTRVMLFLQRMGNDWVRVSDSGGYGGFVHMLAPALPQVLRIAGMCQFGMGFAGERDRTATTGGPVPVRVELANVTDQPAPFHGEAISLKLQTDTRPGEDLAPTWPPGAQPATMTLAGRQVVHFDWDLVKLFPGEFQKPGSYWLTLDGPAGGSMRWLAITVTGQ